MSRVSLPVAALALSLALVRPSPAQVAAPPAIAAPGPALPSGAAAAEGFVPDRLDRLHARLTRFVDDGEVAGLVSMIVRHGKVVDVHLAGFRDRDQRQAMTRDTIFRIYSMSKIITSVAVLTLVEDGRLRLDDPIGAFLPALAAPRVFTGGTAAVPQLVPARRPITIRHLLTHTSGFAYGLSPSVVDDMYRDARLLQARSGDDFVARVAKLPLISQPGEQFYYGVNTDLLGVIVEKVTGQTLGAYVKARILDPLGMADTGFDVPAAKRSRLATLYQRQDTGPLTAVAALTLAPEATGDLPYPDPEGRLFHSGGGGMFSTADDYARFAQMLLNGGTLGTSRILGRKTVEMMRTDQDGRLDKPTVGHGGFGFGVSVRRDLAGGALAGSIGEFGWSGAATTTVSIDPQEEMVMLLLTQHLPYDQPRLFGVYTAMVEAALR
jgi:CubicO group peptidase (beta-lactamase class C family)